MTNDRFLELLKWMDGEARKINGTKSHDYAEKDETLKNFKQMASVINAFQVGLPATGSKQCIIMMMLKIQRLLNLVQSGKKPKNESVLDTVLDLNQYGRLLMANLVDEGKVVIAGGG